MLFVVDQILQGFYFLLLTSKGSTLYREIAFVSYVLEIKITQTHDFSHSTLLLMQL